MTDKIHFSSLNFLQSFFKTEHSSTMVIRCFILLSFVVIVFAGWEKSVLRKHNALRSKVARGKQKTAPKAKYMAKMVWDKKLARQAQAYANKCVFEHDTNRGDVGENLAMNSKKKSYKIMVQQLYDEVKLAPVKNYNKMTNELFSLGLGHYTQIVWGKSRKLGCGYKKGCAHGGFKMEYLVCRYDPPGNYPGRPIYETGRTCSNCKGKCKKGLCSGKMKKRECSDQWNNCKQLVSQFGCRNRWNKHIPKGCRKACKLC